MCGGGERLPAGNLTDKGADRVTAAVAAINALSPSDYDQPKAKSRLTDLSDIAENLDHQLNPGAFRICQDMVVELQAVPVLIGLAQRSINDAVRCKSMEVLARLAFGNPGAAEAVAGDHPGLAATVGGALGGNGPQQLAGLQLAQAIAASPGASVKQVIPTLVQEVRLLLEASHFGVLAQTALEVMVSASFHDATAVASAMPPSLLMAIVTEDDSRPSWLPLDPVHVHACGLLAANILAAPWPEDQDGTALRQHMAEHLQQGHFVEYFHSALDAAASQIEWPQGSALFHSPERMAQACHNLATLGYHRRLVGAVCHLARIVETARDVRTSNVALAALRSLSRDIECLEALLSLSSFRQDTLALMCSSGEEVEAANLVSHLAGVEAMFQAAQDALDVSKHFIPNAPSVRSLAELFSQLGSLDEEVETERLLEALGSVPVGPRCSVQASLLVFTASRKFSFQDFARHVYGTPTLLGWWPSLMEETARIWRVVEAGWGPSAYALPTLPQLLALYERGAEGKSTLSSLRLLEDVVPSLGFQLDGCCVEQAFARIHGKERLLLEEFAQWLGDLYASAALEEREAAEAQAHEETQG